MLESQRQPVPRNDASELDTALAFLRFSRESVLKKLKGLSEEQVRVRHVVSDSTLLGLVQHLTDGEHHWFGYMFGGKDEYEDLTYSMVVDADRSAAEVVAAYRAAAAESDALIEAVGNPEASTVRLVGDRHQTLRWVLAHVTSETARHAGHADILRELTDEVTGR